MRGATRKAARNQSRRPPGSRPAVLRRKLDEILRYLRDTEDEQEREVMIHSVRGFIQELPERVGWSRSPSGSASGSPPPSPQSEATGVPPQRRHDRAVRRRPHNLLLDRPGDSSRKRRVEDVSADDTPTGASDTPPSPKKRKRGRPPRKLHSEADLPRVTLAIDVDYSIDRTEAVMKTFCQDLIGKLPNTGPDRHNALAFTKFFFHEVMGQSGLDRLSQLVNAYSSVDGELLDAGAINRTRDLARDGAAPQPVRQFFLAYYQEQLLERTSNPLIQHLLQLMYARNLLLEYRSIRQKVQEDDREILAFLANQGFTTKVGHDRRSITIDCLSKLAKIERCLFVNTCERAKGVESLVGVFGEGILPLLPPGAMNRLREMGNDKMRPAYELLKSRVVCFQPICDMVKKYIFDPFKQGVRTLPIATKELSTDGAKSFLAIMKGAVEDQAASDDDDDDDDASDEESDAGEEDEDEEAEQDDG